MQEADIAFDSGLIQSSRQTLLRELCSTDSQGLGASGTIISPWLLSKTGFLNVFLTANSGRLCYQEGLVS